LLRKALSGPHISFYDLRGNRDHPKKNQHSHQAIERKHLLIHMYLLAGGEYSAAGDL
jgi:hypothetical protein